MLLGEEAPLIIQPIHSMVQIFCCHHFDETCQTNFEPTVLLDDGLEDRCIRKARLEILQGVCTQVQLSKEQDDLEHVEKSSR